MKRKTKKILGWGLAVIIFLSLTLLFVACIVSETNCSYLFAIGLTLLIYLGTAVLLSLIYLAIDLICS
jgi:hypothetical protein